MLRVRVLWLALALALMAVALAAFVVERVESREPSCSVAREAGRSLDVHSPEDRAHLQRDLASIDAAADAFAAAVARQPLLSDSVDAVENRRTAPARARSWCRETLRQQLLRIHQLSRDELSLVR